MSQSQRTGLIVVVGVIVILIAVGFATSSREKSTDASAPAAQTSAAISEAPVKPSAAQSAVQPKKPASGNYEAECFLAGSTMVGPVVDNKKADPATLDSFGIRNNNTGKVTTVKKGEANCTFMPVD